MKYMTCWISGGVCETDWVQYLFCIYILYVSRPQKNIVRMKTLISLLTGCDFKVLLKYVQAQSQVHAIYNTNIMNITTWSV